MVHREYYILFKTRHVCLEESQYEALVPVMQQCIEAVFGPPSSRLTSPRLETCQSRHLTAAYFCRL